MKIYLAGMNVDTDLLAALRSGESVNAEALTPETISAAYARISRNPADVNRLREEARAEVEKARRSNETIVFGLGHASVAEHACFNFDVIDVSRLAIEHLQHFRLASYTEKSQRYIRIEDDGLVPEEFSDPDVRQPFVTMVKRQNRFYEKAYREIQQALEEKGERSKEAELKAKEDARYALPLAIRGQLGMTVNARTLEHMVQRMAAAPLAEVRELAERLSDSCRHLVPSLVKYTEPEPFDHEDARLGAIVRRQFPDSRAHNRDDSVLLLDCSEDPDGSILATLLFHLRPISYPRAKEAVRELDGEQRRALFLEMFRHMESYHSVRREFENTWFSFQFILSATAFAQLKRHRMGTLIAQPYEPILGVTVPDTFFDACVETGYFNLVEEVNQVWSRLRAHHEAAADYVLTNGHKRRVLFTVNARELYHFARLRSDVHAQWDIRSIANRAIDLVKEQAPLTFLMACGKHRFEEVREEVFGDE